MTTVNSNPIDELILQKQSALSEAYYRLEAMKSFGPLKFLDINAEETYVASIEEEWINLHRKKVIESSSPETS